MSNSCSLLLPPHFRTQDVLSFHQRDSQAIAEKVDGQTLQKGLIWHGQPACLTLQFKDGYANAELLLDGETENNETEEFRFFIRHLLGLTQNIDAFEQRYNNHPQLGALILQQSGLRIPQAASPFEALTWAVTGQQISLKAAISVRRNLILAANIKHSNGLYCYPSAAQIANLTPDLLRQAGFSSSKVQTLLTLSHLVLTQQLPLHEWLNTNPPPLEEIFSKLMQVRGIGAWTINYTLLRGFACLDGGLEGDAGVKRGLQILLNSPEKISESQAKQWLAQFSPWRALVAAHLWSFQ